MIVDVIIPALNEEKSIGLVLEEIAHPQVRNIIVVNNGSTDQTAEVAKARGAIVLDEMKRGYGNACLKGIEFVNSQPKTADVVVFMDADHSDYPDEIEDLLLPIKERNADLVIGSRENEQRQRGSMTPQQIFGNRLATFMIRVMYRHRFTDLGPFRAIQLNSLNSLKMKDKTYGWTVEMQVKALRQKMRCEEVPVKYRPRIGVSKVSGTVKGTILAGYKIITTILKYSI